MELDSSYGGTSIRGSEAGGAGKCVRKPRLSATFGRDSTTLWSVGTLGGVGDSELLARFLLQRDEAAETAFRILVERHGAMVLSVCQQILGDVHDAHDAAQAVFLVLARKAGSIRKRGSVAPWLHGVARRVAAEARRRCGGPPRDRARTISAAARNAAVGQFQETSVDWGAIHEEVARLPEKYRAPVVLCYLEGLTYEETAQRVGCPVGTVRVRLSCAVTGSAPAWAAAASGQPCSLRPGHWLTDAIARLPQLSLPTGWVERDCEIGPVVRLWGFSSGRDGLGRALGPKQEVLRAMTSPSWGSWVFGLLVVGVVTVGGTALLGQEKQKAPGPPRVNSEPREVTPTKTERREQLARKVLRAAVKRLDAQRAYYEEGRITIDRFVDASRQVRDAEARVAKTQDERVVAARAGTVDRVAAILKRETDELEVGRWNDCRCYSRGRSRPALDLAMLDLYDTEQPGKVQERPGDPRGARCSRKKERGRRHPRTQKD